MHLILLQILAASVPIVLSATDMAMQERIYMERYFVRYGYTVPKLHQNEEDAKNEFERAIKEFQWFAGLNPTGELTEETKQIMNLPRCGVPDKINKDSMMRKKRYVLQGKKWEKSSRVTYSITRYSYKLNRQDVDRVIDEAFRVWSRQSNINFQRTQGKSDIEIKFVTGNHGDGHGFDGSGGTLAHAFPPDNGDTHFDDEEKWVTSDNKEGINLLHTAVHELGHALGLSHSTVKDSVMYFAYSKPKIPMELHMDDILAIQNLYGHRENYKPPVVSVNMYPKLTKPSSEKIAVTQKPSEFKPNAYPNICDDASFDAVTRTDDGYTWFFKGYYVWKVKDGTFDYKVALIKSEWEYIDTVDAALTLPDGKTYLFKENIVWLYQNKRLQQRFPNWRKNVFPYLPDGNIEAAFISGMTGNPHFIIGENVWSLDLNYMRAATKFNLRNWLRGDFKEKIDAAYMSENGINYFFVKNKYYRYDKENEDMISSPKENAFRWFGCNKNYKTPLEYDNELQPQKQEQCINLATSHLFNINVLFFLMVYHMITLYL